MKRDLEHLIKRADTKEIKDLLEDIEFQLEDLLDLIDTKITDCEEYGQYGKVVADELAAVHNKINRQKLQVSLMRLSAERSVVEFDIGVLDDEE
jgi:vacuolar-type H+-ATPase subunit E/Vma4